MVSSKNENPELVMKALHINKQFTLFFVFPKIKWNRSQRA